MPKNKKIKAVKSQEERIKEIIEIREKINIMKLGIFPEIQKFIEICNNYVKDGMSNSGKNKNGRS